MTSCTLSLTPVNGELRIYDLHLAERLGFDRFRDIRKIIQRHETNLLKFGVCATVARTHGELGGRPTTEYYLNQKQAIYVCMKSETERASDVQIEIVHVFDAYLEGRPPPEPAGFAEELISAAQEAALRNKVWTIGRCFHMDKGGDWAGFALLRENFGVPNACKLPARHYGRALDLLDRAETQAMAFKYRVIEIERKFFKSRFQSCPPELEQLAKDAEVPLRLVP